MWFGFRRFGCIQLGSISGPYFWYLLISLILWTHNIQAATILQVTDEETGATVCDEERLDTIKQMLCNVLKVMHFAGQHPGGGGVPAGCMAFPGYVGPPDGMGNSEMTWLPLLAGTARTLGTSGSLDAAYGSPYATMDDVYRAQTFGHTSFLQPASRC